jgi:mono/diheme cytochrome c family protein
MRIISHTGAAVVVLWTAAFASLPALAQKKRSVWDGVYSAEQAKRGVETFKSQCASCHGESMTGGGGAPAAAGPEFVFNWKGKSMADLLEYVKANMPPGSAGSLSDRKYTDLLAAMLQTSEFPAGQAELPTDASELAQVQILLEKPSGA